MDFLFRDYFEIPSDHRIETLLFNVKIVRHSKSSRADETAWLPPLFRVLYLDADMICTVSLLPLLSLPFAGQQWAALAEEAMPGHYRSIYRRLPNIHAASRGLNTVSGRPTPRAPPMCVCKRDS